ncbi:hypothetical protein SAMN05192553_103485 [Cyclobacterium xiamenense]|uniref:Uncharacterized protein n=1 Tax=Cyclobacterium xiamenense TaxID=1297121 RepID=A0A1H6Y7L8_9BACT|nr:hypothetical protein SAMN05192553_103485 [Cyclobacterium xiamenense]
MCEKSAKVSAKLKSANHCPISYIFFRIESILLAFSQFTFTQRLGIVTNQSASFTNLWGFNWLEKGIL